VGSRLQQLKEAVASMLAACVTAADAQQRQDSACAAEDSACQSKAIRSQRAQWVRQRFSLPLQPEILDALL
jgi:uncharacterized lipoprotein YbaY